MNVFVSCMRALSGHWRRHPLQCASIVCGLWLATALWSGVQALNAQARQDYARASAVLAGPVQAQWLPRQGTDLDQDVYVRLRRAGWQVSPVLEGRLRFPGDPPVALRVLGIEPLSLPAGTAVAGQAVSGFDLAGFIGQPGQSWAGPDTLARLGLRDGDTPVTLDGERLPPLRLQAGLAPGVIVMDIGHAQALLHAEGRVSRLLLAPGQAQAPPAPWDQVLMLARAEDRGDLDRLTESFHLNLAALGMLAFIVGLFIVHAAIGLALEQRRGLLRTLRALGVSLPALVTAMACELGLFALVGGLAGVASGYLLAGLLLGDMAASLRGLYGAEVAGRLSLPAWWWLAGVGMTLLGVLAAGGGSLLRAARLPLLAVARPQAWRGAQAAGRRRQAVAGGLLLLLAAGCGVWGDGLATAFAMQAAILLAAALLLPSLLDGALAWGARRAQGPLASWFVADSRQQLPALSLALMALLLALGASVGVGSMTEGFRKTFTGWLDQRLSADIYVTPRDSAQGLAAAAWLRTQADVQAVLPQWRAATQLHGWPVELQGVVDHAQTRRQWPLLARTDDAWAQLEAGRGVMISEQLARRLGVGLGGKLALFEGVPDAPPPYTVAAIYADYGNPRGHVLMDAAVLRRFEPRAALRSLNVYAPAGRLAALRATLEQRYGGDGMQVVDQASIKAWSTQIFERTFAATGALNALTLGVAGIALFISLLTLSHSRLAQLAPLWALGVPRGHLAWLALGQVLTLSAMTVLCAMPLGVLLAWTLVAVVNVQAFGWRLPLHVFPGQLLQLAAMGLLASLLAAAWPLWQLRRRRPAELLRRFADET
ncbi:FtsX-like permease family protein [Bordetella bronchialis]|uniref:ABC transporter permease n=1 Tax=Bordetella bronchialis TaxID=463025 RepID=A0A193FRH7_9BORD|nr:FtsX-like permease family protein [Bordetella bronchialis]ANN69689.1 ABC transporter permease [Bordetella bronchialis]ANN74833.1 ABC transporter permease [Bordetella bronchialis]